MYKYIAQREKTLGFSVIVEDAGFSIHVGPITTPVRHHANNGPTIQCIPFGAVRRYVRFERSHRSVFIPFTNIRRRTAYTVLRMVIIGV